MRLSREHRLEEHAPRRGVDEGPAGPEEPGVGDLDGLGRRHWQRVLAVDVVEQWGRCQARRWRAKEACAVRRLHLDQRAGLDTAPGDIGHEHAATAWYVIESVDA